MIRCWFRDYSKEGSPWVPAWLVSASANRDSHDYPTVVIAVDEPARCVPSMSLQLRTARVSEVRIKSPAMDIFTDPVRPDAATASEKSPPVQECSICGGDCGGSQCC